MNLARRLHAAVAASLFTCSVAPLSAQDQPFRSITAAAQGVAPQVASELKAAAGNAGEALTVGVFAFGDEQGNVNESNAFAAKTFPGELTTYLRNQAGRSYVVLDPFELKEKIAGSGVDASQIKAASFKQAATALRTMGLNAAIVGKFHEAAEGGYNVHADVLFDTGAPLQVGSAISALSPSGDDGQWDLNSSYSTRFSVGVYVDGEEVPLYQEGAFERKYILDLDRARHYDKPFAIRIINRGLPPVGWKTKRPADEQTRFFTAAVYVDGVNSIYEKCPDGTFHPSQGHPKNATKWVIGRQGYQILQGYDSDRNPTAQKRVDGYGSALVDIVGFQLNGESAGQFVFTDAGESIAHDVGTTKEIGTISIYFYGEMMDDDQKYLGPEVYAFDAGGTRIGKTLQHRVFGVNVKTHPEPVEVWQILYRYRGYEGDIQNRPDAVPIAVATQQQQEKLARDPPYEN